MTKYVSIIGNGESRRGFDISPLKLFSTVIGCNALYRDFVAEYLICVDKHMCQQAANAVGKGTTIYTRDRWADQFAMWPNVKKLPDLPYAGDQRQDEPFHWGAGPYAGVLGLTFKPKASFLLFSSISLNISSLILKGGMTAVESPLCTPAGSRCSRVPAI